MQCIVFTAAALLLSLPVLADSAEENALLLADEAPAVSEPARDWRLYLEAAAGQTRQRWTGEHAGNQRLSLDLQYAGKLAADWRLTLADRLDVVWPAAAGQPQQTNTLKEAYLSWQLEPTLLLDFGRVNLRHGVATGYNPTDYFADGAIRSATSINPTSLKENRQGSVLLRAQYLWAGGALNAVYSPALSDQPRPGGFHLDVGATNHQQRWLVSVSQKFGEQLNPQFLLFGQQGSKPQLGLNLTRLLNDATVVHFEWSGGRGPDQLASALSPSSGRQAWRNRLSSGLSYTNANKLTLTAEYHYNGAAPDAPAWAQLQRGSMVQYGLYRSWAQRSQQPPTRRALFLHALWQDLHWQGLDLSVMHNVDLIDHSRRSWLEARYHQGQFEYALQWQHSRGQPLSHYGVMPESSAWQALLRGYF